MRRNEKSNLLDNPFRVVATPVRNSKSNPVQSNPIQFDFASVQAGDLRRHVKTNISENHSHATDVTLHLFKQTI